MNNRVVNIETYSMGSNSVSFAGTLRNEKKFELHQIVFIESHGKMYKCRIVGIELPPAENPEYRYLIEIPEELIKLKEGEFQMPGDSKDRISRTCKYIFSSIEEAKESALRQLDHMYELNKDNVLRFFKKYETT